VELNATQLSALTRLFSSAVFKELAKRGRSPLFTRLLKLANISTHCDDTNTVGGVFDTAFSVLKTVGMRSEYVYRAAIAHKIIMGKHSLQTASMLSEFRAGTCKADIVVINGTATAYEIKSERDSLARLARQVDNYKKVFASVNVIASADHVDGVRGAVSPDVGILCLSRRYQISVIREALNRPDRICPMTVFESLRTAEAASILKALGIKVSDVPNTQRHAVMRSCFANLRPIDVHHQMVRTLKRTRNLAPLHELINQLPSSLHAAALSVPVCRRDQSRLVDAVKTPLSLAFSWS